MGTKIISLPSTDAVIADGYFPVSQDITGSNRVTYKVTAQQIASYIGSTTGSGTVNKVEISSTDNSLNVTGSPITTNGIINVMINSVNLDKINSGGATNGQILTYDGIVNQWKPIDSSNTGVTADSVQIGTVLWFAASSAPIGYLECDGSSKKISDYQELAVVLGTTYGALLNGGTEFILPDLRGEFVRGWSHGKTGVDTSRTFGSNQKGTITVWDQENDNTWSITTTSSVAGPTTQITVGADDYNILDYSEIKKRNGSGGGGSSFLKGETNSGAYTGITRPRNVALLPCIKALKTVTATSVLLNFIEKPPSPANGQVLTYDGSTSTWVARDTGTLVSGTATTLNNLSTFGFTGIPSWAKKITIMVSEMSTNGVYSPRLQVGTSAGFITTGYRGTKVGIIDVSTVATGLTDGFAFNDNDAVDAAPHNGCGTLAKLSDTIWCYSGVYGLNAHQTRVGLCGGAVTITGTLDRIRFLTSSPTGTFDGGTVNIMWE